MGNIRTYLFKKKLIKSKEKETITPENVIQKWEELVGPLAHDEEDQESETESE